MTEYRAPFPYFGGKSKIAPAVWQRFGDVSNYVEPFFGSGATLLSRPGFRTDGNWTETVNDKSGFIANFWRALQADPQAVAAYADHPVNENDLHARHAWLVQNHSVTLGPRLEGDPEFYDAKIAGWWVWGVCCWIGGGWCSGAGPWQSVDGELINTRANGDSGQGVNRQRVHLGNSGQGVKRKLVHLGSAGQGVKRQRVHLGSAGQGVKRQLVHLGDSGRGNAGTGEAGLIAWMHALADRLRRVRVCCGDWTRVMGQSVTEKHGIAAIFLDPPYLKTTGRDMGIYEQDCGTVANDVREWAIENGNNPQFRIALCGYTGEHDMPDTWERMGWSTNGGYENQTNGANVNQHREVIWFSPHCLRPAIKHTQLSMFAVEA